MKKPSFKSVCNTYAELTNEGKQPTLKELAKKLNVSYYYIHNNLLCSLHDIQTACEKRGIIKEGVKLLRRKKNVKIIDFKNAFNAIKEKGEKPTLRAISAKLEVQEQYLNGNLFLTWEEFLKIIED